MTFRIEKHITRAMMRAEPRTLFAFGDNIGRKGYGGQAREMRGEPNAVGIPTKWLPSMSEDAFFKDSDFDRVRAAIEVPLGRLAQHLANGGVVVWPEDGIGTGLAELQMRAPRIYAYINAARLAFTGAPGCDRGPPPRSPTDACW